MKPKSKKTLTGQLVIPLDAAQAILRAAEIGGAARLVLTAARPHSTARRLVITSTRLIK